MTKAPGTDWWHELGIDPAYYRMQKHRLGGLHPAKLMLYRVDFHEIETCQAGGDWGRADAGR